VETKEFLNPVKSINFSPNATRLTSKSKTSLQLKFVGFQQDLFACAKKL